MESIFDLLNVTEEEARQMGEETEQMLATILDPSAEGMHRCIILLPEGGGKYESGC